MKRLFALTLRNIKEIIRDITSLIFCLILPSVLFTLLYLLFGKMDVEMFQIDNFAPGIASFGFSFIMLYIALTVSADGSSALVSRIYASPTRSVEYLFSFILASIPLTLAQLLIFYALALIFGITFSGYLLLSIVFMLLITAIFYSACGLLFGVLAKSEKQAGPLCSIIISSAGMLGGVWLPIESIGGAFLTVCKCLPFYNGINLAKLVASGEFIKALAPMGITLAYALVIFIITAIVFSRKRKG